LLDQHYGREQTHALPWWFTVIDAAKYLGTDPIKLSGSPLPWISWASAHYSIHKNFEAAVEDGQDARRGRQQTQAPTDPPPRPTRHAFGETPPQDNRSKGDGGFSQRMRAALQEREEREAERAERAEA
jgi:hypothetical protein